MFDILTMYALGTLFLFGAWAFDTVLGGDDL
jgi:hypothetical protein